MLVKILIPSLEKMSRHAPAFTGYFDVPFVCGGNIFSKRLESHRSMNMDGTQFHASGILPAARKTCTPGGRDIKPENVPIDVDGRARHSVIGDLTVSVLLFESIRVCSICCFVDTGVSCMPDRRTSRRDNDLCFHNPNGHK